MEKAEAVERVIDRAAATFDATAIPERPKSACESTILMAAEKFCKPKAAGHHPNQYEKHSSERIQCLQNGVRSRESSGGRHSSTEREGKPRSREREIGIRAPKSVQAPKLPVSGNRNGDFSFAEVRAIIHAEPNGLQHMNEQERRFSAATVPRQTSGSRKENIYENVAYTHDNHPIRNSCDSPFPTFRKQNSLETLLSNPQILNDLRKNDSAVVAAVAAAVSSDSRRIPPTPLLRKVDSFEGHEEAVRSLVAAVQENRVLRKKKSK